MEGIADATIKKHFCSENKTYRNKIKCRVIAAIVWIHMIAINFGDSREAFDKALNSAQSDSNEVFKRQYSIMITMRLYSLGYTN